MPHSEHVALRYIRKTGICCVFVASPYARHNPVRIDWDREMCGPSATKKITFWRRMWCAKQSAAEDLLTAFGRAAASQKFRPVGQWFDMAVEEAERVLRRCADEQDIPLTENATVVERAKLFAEALNGILAEKNRTGEMKEINKAYKAYRQQQVAAGKRGMDYNEFVELRLDPVLDAVVLRIFGERSA